eukprot:8611247-Prorocentrum_lima.AAC.1
MTSSLVGSEMCIRDSLWNLRFRTQINLTPNSRMFAVVEDGARRPLTAEAVSYTHLTLPTICSV